MPKRMQGVSLWLPTALVVLAALTMALLAERPAPQNQNPIEALARAEAALRHAGMP